MRVQKPKFGGLNRVLAVVAAALACLVVGTSFPHLVQADLSDGLVAHYTFDDISGVTVPDSSGNNYDGELQNGAVAAAGKLGSGVQFDGTDDMVLIPFQLLQTQEPTFSYSFFVKTDADGDSEQFLLGQAASGSSGHFCQAVTYDNTTDNLDVFRTNFENDHTIRRNVDLSEWTHVVVTNSEADGQSRLYLNGTAIGGLDSTCPQALGPYFTLGRALWPGFNLELKGILDDVRVYDRVLSNDEVAELNNQGLTNSLAITTPTEGATVHGTTPIQATASGSPSMSSVQFYANGEALGSADASPPYEYSWDTSALEEGEYLISAVGTDTNGDAVAATTVTVTVDTDPSFQATNSHSLGQTTATVAWVTDQPTSGQLEYGTTTGYGSTTALQSELTYYHSATLTGLTPGTTYHFRATADDANDNTANSADNTFTTLEDYQGQEWHVTTDGSAGGDGSLDDPWDLQTALDQPDEVEAGDTIWVHGGTYLGNFTSTLAGSATRPLVVRNYNQERAIIDGGTSNSEIMYLSGSNTWYWGLEVISSNPDRTSPTGGDGLPGRGRGEGFFVIGPNIRIINNLSHDTAQGMGNWGGASGAEIYGNLLYYNGWQGSDGGAGHGLYMNNSTGMKNVENNFLFSNFGFGIHAYTQGGQLNNILMRNNTSFYNGHITDGSVYTTNILLGGYPQALNAAILGNAAYSPQSGGGGLDLGYTGGCNYCTVTDNFLSAGTALRNIGASPEKVVQDNLFYGAVPSNYSVDYADNTYASSVPSSTTVLFRPNAYESDKANITIYNWPGNSTVSLDPSSVLDENDTYEVVDVQNYFGEPVASGTYTGGNLAIPMTSTAVTAAVGNNLPTAASHTPSEFGTFMLVKTGHSSPPAEESGSSGSSSSSSSSSSATSSAGTTQVSRVGRGQQYTTFAAPIVTEEQPDQPAETSSACPSTSSAPDQQQTTGVAGAQTTDGCPAQPPLEQVSQVGDAPQVANRKWQLVVGGIIVLLAGLFGCYLIITRLSQPR